MIDPLNEDRECDIGVERQLTFVGSNDIVGLMHNHSILQHTWRIPSETHDARSVAAGRQFHRPDHFGSVE